MPLSYLALVFLYTALQRGAFIETQGALVEGAIPTPLCATVGKEGGVLVVATAVVCKVDLGKQISLREGYLCKFICLSLSLERNDAHERLLKALRRKQRNLFASANPSPNNV